MRNKILIIDPLSPKGHIDINKVTLDLLKNKYDVHYLASEYYKGIVPPEVFSTFYKESLFDNRHSPLKNRIIHYKAFKKMIKDMRAISDVTCVIVMSYELLSTALLVDKLKRYSKNVLFLNHNNVDETKNHFLKKLCFKHIFRIFKPIVYEEYIKDFIQQTYKIDSCIVRHNLNMYKTIDVPKSIIRYRNINKNTVITALSGNILDKTIIDDIVKADKSGLLKRVKVHFFIKHKSVIYESDNLTIINDYLSDEEYRYLLSATNYNMLIYEDSYQYRVSGVYFDSISFEKPVIYSPNAFFNNQVSRFGRIGISFSSVDQLLLSLSSANYDEFTKNVQKVYNYYSNENVIKDYESIIEEGN